MNSVELRRIVERLNLPWSSEPWWSQSDRDKITLANHADALVALAQACEELRDSNDMIETTVRLRNVLQALAAVHAVKEHP